MTTITPELAKSIGALCGHFAEWVRGQITEDDQVCALAHVNIKRTLQAMARALPLVCPYCNADLGQPDVHYDQAGHSEAMYKCPRCHARVVVKNIPPAED